MNFVRDIIADIETTDSQGLIDLLMHQRANFELRHCTVLIKVQRKQDKQETHQMDQIINRFESINPAYVERFLQEGNAFRALVTQIKLLTLPDSLQDIIISADRYSITISSINCTFTINKLKASLEDCTRCEWDWWPLAPRMHDLKPGEMRIEWKVSECMVITAALNTETRFSLVLRAMALSKRNA